MTSNKHVLPAASRGDLCVPAGRSEGCYDDQESETSSLFSASSESVASPHSPTAAGPEPASVWQMHSGKGQTEDKDKQVNKLV